MILWVILQAESDRIANEIRRKKEKESQELGQEGTKKMVSILFSMQELVVWS